MPNFTGPSASPGAARPRAAAWFAHVVLLAAPWAVNAQVPAAPVEGLRDASPRVHALTGARIVTAPGAVIERGTVVLRDGLIAAVGPDADVNVPADARVWPAEGKTIYAGLVEPLAEVHLPAALKAPAPATPGGRRSR